MNITAPRGTKDVLLDESYKWQYVEERFRHICNLYGYSEIRTPIFEHTELFQRGVGETTDIVQKEMYTFKDRSDRSLTLKPEGTAGAARSFIEHNLYAETPITKLYYITNAFRYEKPQSGRYRQFEQLGLEAYGSANPATDAEIINMLYQFLHSFDVRGLEVHINSIGCSKCRADYSNALREYFKSNLEKMCGDCKARFENNPLRLLDCKVPVCKEIGENAPVILDYLCDDCKEHLEKLKKYLEDLNINYKVDPKIVRGLDYYTRTVFEIISDDEGFKGTICGGGRYDKLIEECGGPATPAVGYAIGMERLLMVLENQGCFAGKKPTLDIYIASIGENAAREAFKIVNALREKGISADFDHIGKSVKAQMRYADKISAKFTAVIGDNEIESRQIKLKNMQTGEAKDISLEQIEENIKNN